MTSPAETLVELRTFLIILTTPERERERERERVTLRPAAYRPLVRLDARPLETHDQKLLFS
jgi:hypothetical protein